MFDNQKHYFVGDDEMEKLLAKGEGWLAAHPEKEEIARRYLQVPAEPLPAGPRPAGREEEPVEAEEDDRRAASRPRRALEKPLSLNEQRLGAVLAALRASGARRVLDLGCGEGKLLRELLKDRQFEEIVGMDVSIRSLEIAARPAASWTGCRERRPHRIKLIHGSLIYRDERLEGFDAAAVVEVVEHLDPPRLAAFERVLFEFARPGTVVLTTPNREYNVTWETLPAGQVPPPRPPLRVDPAGVPGLGRGRRRAVRLRGAVPAGRAGGRGASARRRRWPSFHSTLHSKMCRVWLPRSDMVYRSCLGRRLDSRSVASRESAGLSGDGHGRAGAPGHAAMTRPRD